MIINWYGEGCFKISARGGSSSGGQTSGITILTDPFGRESGLTPPRLKAEVVLRTLISFPIRQPADQSALQIIGPGGYEFAGIEFSGWPLIKESTNEFLKTVYLLKAEDLNLCFLGHIANNLEPSILEKLAEVDLLFIPAGGKPFISQETAAKLIKQIEPKLVIASFFKIPGLKRKADDIKEFLKELELKAEPQEKLTIKKRDLPAKTGIVVFKI